MRRILILAYGLVLCGCAEPPAHDTTGVVPGVDSPPAAVLLPDYEKLSNLGLLSRKGTVKVGMTREEALDMFVEPPGSYEKSDLPPSIAAPFEAFAWQTRTEGFGMILYQNKVGAAVHEIDKVTPDRLDEVVRAYQSQYGPAFTHLQGRHVEYWFWQSRSQAGRGDHLLMVTKVQAKPNLLNITEAIGTVPVMEALRMTEQSANGDLARADRMLDEQRPKNGKS